MLAPLLLLLCSVDRNTRRTVKGILLLLKLMQKRTAALPVMPIKQNFGKAFDAFVPQTKH
ncbi:hypothetical protein ACMA1I_08115 [Pontibacter sp. 13R65]|uniref:hypothetical protein n=1 Tax=Pontibacter sp. 13R65 TaxID=3127458 RepID=UPI0039C97B4E